MARNREDGGITQMRDVGKRSMERGRWMGLWDYKWAKDN